MDYRSDYYVLTVETEDGEKREIESTQFRHKCHRTYFVYTEEEKVIEYITYLQEGRFPTNLKKPYAVIPQQQEELEKALKKEEEKYKIEILKAINSNNEGLSSLSRENAQELPKSYGLYLFRIKKPDIDKLLRGEILYFDDEYTFAIGMADKDIKDEKDN